VKFADGKCFQSAWWLFTDGKAKNQGLQSGCTLRISANDRVCQEWLSLVW
jgi:hypothetical protein